MKEGNNMFTRNELNLLIESIFTYRDNKMFDGNNVGDLDKLEEKCIKLSNELSMQNLRDYMKNLDEEQLENFKENEEEIYIAISNEEVVINKQDNTVISSFGNYNSVHDIVEELLNR